MSNAFYNVFFVGDLIRRKKASDLHRTATTTYLCCVPTLEDFAGAGRVGLASGKGTDYLYICKN